MSGVHRFLSRRDKKNPRHTSPTKDKDAQNHPTQHAKRPVHFGGIFAIEDDPKIKLDKDEERTIQGVLERLRTFGIDTMVEANARYALRLTKSHGDGDAAFRLLMLLQETYEGIVRPYTSDTKLLGAANREGVTCYLDALLFAMFARLDSFEAMLYENFDDVPRRKLAGLLRLWVNMLRTGRLITTDITRHLQDALSDCGWIDAAMLRQQDPSEAFTFITGKLELPLLTLKMDLHHAGKEDPQDDHKFINERLLEVAIVDEPQEGSAVITLEDCLEHYFNNRIEVKRHLENQRRNTLKSAMATGSSPVDSPTKLEKDRGIHVEVAELSSPSTPLVQTPIAETPTFTPQFKDPLERIRPGMGRKRGNSIFSQRKVELVGIDPEKTNPDTETAVPERERERKLSTRTEVLMPAWQFFKLLPWYTDHMPESDAQVAAHFSNKRPVLGICLKRYSYTNTGQATRLNTFIDIPTEIAVPNFVSDEHMQDEGPLIGNFRLLLQSVVCHRGVSVHSGHYVTLCRGGAPNATGSRRSSSETEDVEESWMRFDDLAKERVSYVDIREALRQETPYLLFYQVQPVGEDGNLIHELPSYAEATSRAPSEVTPLEKSYPNGTNSSKTMLQHFPPAGHSSEAGRSDSMDFAIPPSGRASLDATTTLDGYRGRTSFQGDERRKSINSSFAGSVSGASLQTDNTASVPSTPKEEKHVEDKNTTGLLAVANKFTGSRRGSRVSKGSKSRNASTDGGSEGNGIRFSLNMSRLTQKMSRGDMTASTTTLPAEALVATSSSETSDGELVASSEESAAAERKDGITVEGADSARPSIEVGKPGVAKRSSKTPTGTMMKKEKTSTKAEKRRRKGEEDRECVMM